MTHAVLLERKTRPTQDMLSSMFSAGSMDPASLPSHPCPPGRKDGTMKTNLMEFQVSESGIFRYTSWLITFDLIPPLNRNKD